MDCLLVFFGSDLAPPALVAEHSKLVRHPVLAMPWALVLVRGIPHLRVLALSSLFRSLSGR